jgi:hypothetical protein
MSYISSHLGSEIDAAVDEVEAISGSLVGTAGSQTITNKTINPPDNTIDGDKLDISWNPTNYIPDSSISEADDADDLSAHLKGIDSSLGLYASTSNILWVYRNTAMTGWAVKADVTDVVLAVKGGSESYNVNGGVSASGSSWAELLDSETNRITGSGTTTNAFDTSSGETKRLLDDMRPPAAVGTLQYPDI